MLLWKILWFLGFDFMPKPTKF